MKIFYTALVAAILFSPIAVNAECCNADISCVPANGGSALGYLKSVPYFMPPTGLICKPMSGDTWFSQRCNTEIQGCKDLQTQNQGGCKPSWESHQKIKGLQC